MRIQWTGYYLDGRTAARREVTVTLTPELIQISEGSLTLGWPYKEVTQSEGFYDNELVRLEKDGAALVVREPEFLTALRAVAPKHSRRFHDPEKRRKRRYWIPAAAAASLTLAAFLYFLGIPAAAAYMAERIPPEWEEELGRRALPSLTTGLDECEDEKLNSRIDTIVKRLGADELPYTIRVHVLESEAVNAFALPGGEIVVLTGLIELTDTPEELAGVLAHEMQHVIRRHSTKGIIENLSTSMLFRFMAGDAGNIVNNLGSLRYSRIHEREADEKGIELMAASGVDPSGLTGFFSKISGTGEELPEALGYISSHPMATERISYLKEKIAGLTFKSTPLLPGVDWVEARGACSPSPATEAAADDETGVLP